MPDSYATLDELKAQLSITDASQDDLLQLYLDAATEWVDSHCRTTFSPTDVELEEYDGTGTRFIQLRSRPVSDVTAVQISGSDYSGTYELSKQCYLVLPSQAADYDNPRLFRGGEMGYCDPGWPIGTNNIAVSYTYGHDTVPSAVALATLIISADWFDKDSRRGIASESLGPRSVTYLATEENVPKRALALLAKYRQPLVMG